MINRILERLEEEIKKIGDSIDKGMNYPYALGANNAYETALEIVQEVAKEYGTVNDNDLAVVSALPSLYPLQKFEEEAIHKVVASAKDGGWIPCSERLPKENGLEHYEITFLSGLNNTPFRSVAIFSKGRWYMPGTNCRYCDWFPYEVIAWKEPSAPYQKGE